MFKSVKALTFLVTVNFIFQVFSLPATHYVSIRNGELHRIDDMICSCVHKNDTKLHMKYVPPVQQVHFLSKRSTKSDTNDAVNVDVQRFFQQLVSEIQKQISDYIDNAMSSLQQLESDRNKHHKSDHSEDRKTAAEIRKNKRIAGAKVQEVSSKVMNLVSDEINESANAANKIVKFVERKMDRFNDLHFDEHK